MLERMRENSWSKVGREYLEERFGRNIGRVDGRE
jgi:hypothetical protein